ncbi:NAD(P)-dependent oxidoreductase [Loigolactobacillus zhaoyuanensis]|uniref:NAD(P)-dependent oxidoreductase n=1 Tax=Loigolactobacillus zhaoyuanensis TaxID=2486017 RepID=A0ABW8U996_9LACO|nr:NAD(P)-dependent oxidoreductase [Loigolactobacillus zhaoyuanensis]
MKIGVIGATGKAGSLITSEALQRGHQVTAIVRHPEKLKLKLPVLAKDLFALRTADLTDFDVVVDAFRAPTGQEEQHQTSLQHLVDILHGTAVRLLVVGGAGSLYVDDAQTMRLYETPAFKDEWKPTSVNMGEALIKLQQVTDVQWTYLSPAAAFLADAPRTGSYQVGGERLLTNAAGKSEISFADFAIAMVDEIEKPQHIQQRFTVASR